VRGFPNPDFVFGDITPLLVDGQAFAAVIGALTASTTSVVQHLKCDSFLFPSRPFDCPAPA
jgi:hypothetical protein